MVLVKTSEYRKDLEASGLKQTKSRIAVLDILQNEDRPLDALELCTKIQERGIDIDQATVYRILDIFRQKGLIHRFEFQEGKFRYELTGYDHHHLICDACGIIEDIADCDIDRFEDEILKKKGFRVKRHSLEFYGICKSCLR